MLIFNAITLLACMETVAWDRDQNSNDDDTDDSDVCVIELEML